MKTITCKPWNVVDHIRHRHPKDKDIEVRNWYVKVHDRLNEGGMQLSTEPCFMTLVKQGKNFVITRE